MKKMIICCATAALFMSACTTSYKSATQRDVNGPIAAAAIADLEVSSEKVTFTYVPPRKVRAAGVQNCINTAINEALKANGGGDLLVETQRAVIQRTGIFSSKISSVTVTGYPARYRNFRTVDGEILKSALANGAFVVPTTNRK